MAGVNALVGIVGVNKDYENRKRELERALTPILGRNIAFQFSVLRVEDDKSELQMAKQQLKYRDAQLQKKEEANQLLQKQISQLKAQMKQMELENRKSIDTLISSGRTDRSRKRYAASPRSNPAHSPRSPSPDEDTPRESFNRLDTEKKAVVASAAKAEILQSVSKVQTKLLNPFGEPLTDADVQYVFEKCDINADKRISMKEFLAAMDTLHIDISADRLKKFFNHMDTAHDRSLSLEEFREGLKHVSSSEQEIWQKMLESDFVEDLDSPPDIEKIRDTLSKTNTDWRFRISAMHSFMKMCCKKQSKKRFDTLMRPVREPLLLQLGDRRSAVVRECCIVIAKIALTQTSYLTKWAPRIIEVLFETMRIRVEIISVSAHQAARAVVRCVPESRRMELTTQLLKSSSQPYIIVRQKSYQYINMMLHHTREESIKKSKEYWNNIIAGLVKGLQDPSIEVRKAAMFTTCEVYLLNESRTKKDIISKVRKKTAESFYDVMQTYTFEKALTSHS